MIGKVQWLALAVLLAAAPSACCSNALGPPPGLTRHTNPGPRPKRRVPARPIGGVAIEESAIPVEGVPGGKAILAASPTPSPAPSP